MTIVPFCDELAPAFAALNYAWLEQYVGVEEADRRHLENPRETILAGGGEVFFAIEHERVMGTIAAIRHADAIEMAKLCVADDAQRRGIGRRLVQHMLEFARDAGAAKVTLSTSSKLVAARHLYESMGFRTVAAMSTTSATAYATTDVFMELVLATV